MFHGRFMSIYVVQSSKDVDRLQADPSIGDGRRERKKCERATQNYGSVAHEKYSQSFALVLTSIFFCWVFPVDSRNERHRKGGTARKENVKLVRLYRVTKKHRQSYA